MRSERSIVAVSGRLLLRNCELDLNLEYSFSSPRSLQALMQGEGEFYTLYIYSRMSHVRNVNGGTRKLHTFLEGTGRQEKRKLCTPTEGQEISRNRKLHT